MSQLELDMSASTPSPTDAPAPDDAAPASEAAAPEAAAGSEATRGPRAFGRAIGTMHRMMTSEGRLSTGDLAELRRISPDAPYTPALWRLLLDVGQGEAWGGMNQDLYERRMATLAMGLATCAGYHDYRTPLGQALADAGWSELRFVRLMEARGETLEVLIRRLAQFLSSKGQVANWVDVGWLLVGQDMDSAQKTRLRIARSYYGRLHAKDSAS